MTPFKLTDAQLDAAFADGLSACIGAPVRLTPPEPSPDVVCSCHAKREAVRGTVPVPLQQHALQRGWRADER